MTRTAEQRTQRAQWRHFLLSKSWRCYPPAILKSNKLNIGFGSLKEWIWLAVIVSPFEILAFWLTSSCFLSFKDFPALRLSVLHFLLRLGNYHKDWHETGYKQTVWQLGDLVRPQIAASIPANVCFALHLQKSRFWKSFFLPPSLVL